MLKNKKNNLNEHFLIFKAINYLIQQILFEQGKNIYIYKK